MSKYHNNNLKVKPEVLPGITNNNTVLLAWTIKNLRPSIHTYRMEEKGRNGSKIRVIGCPLRIRNVSNVA